MTVSNGIVLLDWNGTVVLDEERARRASNSALERHRLPQLTRRSFRNTFRLPLADFFSDAGVDVSDAADAVADWNRAMLDEDPVLRPGAAAAFTALRDRGYRVGVVSAADDPVVFADIASAELEDAFDIVIGSAIDKQAVLETHRGAADLAFYVGDTAYDMTSAIAADYVPIGAEGGYTETASLTSAGARHLITDLQDVVAIVDTIARGTHPETKFHVFKR